MAECPNCKCKYTHTDECKPCPRCGKRLPELWEDGTICED